MSLKDIKMFDSFEFDEEPQGNFMIEASKIYFASEKKLELDQDGEVVVSK